MTHKKLCCIIPVGPNQVNNDSLINSISRSTSKEVEFILVLDSTPVLIAREIQDFSSIHSNVKILQCSFGNPGGARNLGMNEANSDWISFFDSDDEFSVDEIFNELVDLQSVPDVVIFSFSIESENKKEVFLNQSNLGINSHEELQNAISQFPGIWRWVFNRESLKNSKFLELKMGEDIVFLVNFLSVKRVFTLSSRVIYNYKVGNPSQLTKNLHAKQDLLMACRAAIAIISKNCSKFENKAAVDLTSLLLFSSLKHLNNINRLRLFIPILASSVNNLGNFKLLIALVIKRVRVKYGS